MIEFNKNIIGTIGENLAVCKLLEKGWAAVNINTSINNFNSIDIICFRMNSQTWQHESVLIQVKTLIKSGNESNLNFPTGFDIEKSKDINYLNNNIKGPYIFITLEVTPNGYKPEFYILSREQVKDLLYKSNQWYLSWQRNGPIKEKGVPAGLKLKWIKGEHESGTVKYDSFQNPLNGEQCKDNWDNIWK